MSCANIYTILKSAGINDVGACALLGNFQAESNCDSFRMQGDHTTSLEMSKKYVANVDSGKIDAEEFAKDGIGFGLYQITYPARKRNFHTYVKSKGVSIGDESTQVRFAIKELNEEYSSLLSALKSSTDLYYLVGRVCKEFERPAVNNIDERYKYALNIKNSLKLNFETTSVTSEIKPNYKTAELPLLTQRLSSVELTSVKSCQMLLKNIHNINIDITGKYDNKTIEAVKKFQIKKGLTADGQCGPQTWKLLIEGE